MGFLSALKRSSKVAAEPQEQFHNNYTLGDKLGEGSFGAVYSCHLTTASDSSIVKAAKVFDAKNLELFSNARRDFREEVRLLRLIGKNENCVQLLDAFEEKQSCYIVMEKCACTVAEAFLREHSLNEQAVAHVFRGVLSALKHIHSCGIVHRDVKPSNMLLANGTCLSGSSRVVLCDFGLAKEISKVTTKKQFGPFSVSAGLTEMCGTLPYMAPEMLNERPYGFGVDIWACGVGAYYMLFGQFPYNTSRKSVSLMRDAICNSVKDPSYEARPGFSQPSEEACQFVAWLLTCNPAHRPNATEALTADFLWHAKPPSRKTKQTSSLQNMLLVANNAVEHFIEVSPKLALKKSQDNDERSTDCGSEDRRSNDTEYTIYSL